MKFHLPRESTVSKLVRHLPAGICIGMTACAATAVAQTYPNKPVRFVVTFLPGGPADIVSRLSAAKLSDIWRQSVVVDNRAGANGIVGTDLVAKSAPDGYSMLYVNTSFTINASFYPKLPFDPVRDFVPVTPMAASPAVLVVGPSVPVNSVQELIALAKAKPGSMSFGSTGVGAPGHLYMELLKSTMNFDMVHVPYKGAAGVTTDMLGGRIQATLLNVAAVLPLVKSGKVRPLAIMAKQRWPATPDVPTIAEAGLPGYEQTNWHGISMPAKTSSAIVQKVNADMTKVAQLPDFREKLDASGMAPVSMSPIQFSAFIKNEIDTWEKAVKASGAKPEGS
jgi:tripartite-type tricarboxylate transporter receptor subunit TctC